MVSCSPWHWRGLKGAPQDALGWGARGCVPQRSLGKWGPFYAYHRGHFPSFPQLSQTTSQWVILHETEPIIRWTFLIEATHLQTLPKPCKINFCRKPIKVRGVRGKKKDCVPIESKTMASLNVIKSITKWIWSVNCVSTLNGLMIWEFIQNCCVDFMLMAVWI